MHTLGPSDPGWTVDEDNAHRDEGARSGALPPESQPRPALGNAGRLGSLDRLPLGLPDLVPQRWLGVAVRDPFPRRRPDAEYELPGITSRNFERVERRIGDAKEQAQQRIVMQQLADVPRCRGRARDALAVAIRAPRSE